MRLINTKVIQLLLSISLCISVTLTQAEVVYKWIDDNGSIRYTDHPPIKKEHQTLNAHGVVIKSTEAPKTEKELADEKKVHELAQKKLEQEKNQKQAQDAKDRVLLMTFSSEQELGLVRDNRIEVIDSVIRLIEKSIVTTKQRLARLETDAETQYLSKGQEVPGGLAQNIEHFTKKLDARKSQQRLKQVEKDKINQQFALDLDRYRLLKGL
ncbi:MAG: hypothetical protein ACI9V8_001379 [Urechidicola sp.]|jgi:hypothetical protein